MRSIRACAATLVLVGCASAMPVEDADRTIEVVQEVPGISKDQIFNATKVWVAGNFRSAKQIIEYENREEGTLIGNASIPFPCSGIGCTGNDDWHMPFTMRVDMKDGRFRIGFTNVRLVWTPTPYRSGYDGPVRTQGNWESVKARLSGLAPELRKAIVEGQKKRDF